MVDLGEIVRFMRIKNHIKEKGFTEEEATDIAGVHVFNGENGFFVIGDKRVTLPESYQGDREYVKDGEGFITYEEGEVVGFTMRPEIVKVGALTFRFEEINGKAILHFLDGKPSLLGRLVFYKKNKWQLGRIEDFTTIETDAFIILGVPIIDGKPFIGELYTVTSFGYPENEEILPALLKVERKRLAMEYSTKENLEELASSETTLISMMDRVLTYKDDLLLWEIVEDVLNIKQKQTAKILL